MAHDLHGGVSIEIGVRGAERQIRRWRLSPQVNDTRHVRVELGQDVRAYKDCDL